FPFLFQSLVQAVQRLAPAGIGENIRVIADLVYAADQPPGGDPLYRRVGDLAADRLRKAVQPDDPKGPVEEIRRLSRQWRGDLESVMPLRDDLISSGEMLLTLLPGCRHLCAPQEWREFRGARKPLEGRAEPLGIGRILPLHQEA